MAGQYTKNLRDVLGRMYTYVVTMCNEAEERCPPAALVQGSHKLHWRFPDPAAAAAEEQLQVFRELRDAIDAQMQDWLVRAHEESAN